MAKQSNQNRMIRVMVPSLPRTDDIKRYLNRIDEAARYTNFGPLVSEFEKGVGDMQSRLHGRQVEVAAVSNATTALCLVLKSFDLPPKSKVLLPALTFIATAASVIMAGHIPVVADIDPDSWNLTPESVVPALQKVNAAAVVPVACFGVPQDVAAWSAFSAETDMKVVIDAAGCIGGQKTAPDIPVIFSTHATKALSTGEGGVVVGESSEMISRIKRLSNFGFGEETFEIGINAKISEYAAAIGVADLARFNQTAEKRRALMAMYKTEFLDHSGLGVELQQGPDVFAPTILCIKTASSSHRDTIEASCQSANVETRRWYLPLLQNFAIDQDIKLPATTPVADDIEQCLVGLPFSLDMEHADVMRVIEAIRSAG